MPRQSARIHWPPAIRYFAAGTAGLRLTLNTGKFANRVRKASGLVGGISSMLPIFVRDAVIELWVRPSDSTWAAGSD